MTWLSAALPYVAGGFFGAAVTFGLTWVRERRRTLDAYRAPQRQAIGDIVAATHEFMLRDLESRTAQTEVIQHIRDDLPPSVQLVGQLWATAAAAGSSDSRRRTGAADWKIDHCRRAVLGSDGRRLRRAQQAAAHQGCEG